jgi:LTXXQ motif family protein
VNRMLPALVVALSAAVAMPVFAQPAETTGTPQAQTVPANEQGQGGSAQSQVGGTQAGGAQGAGEQAGGGPWMHRQWMRGQGRWDMQGGPMMRRMGMMRWDPRERCIDRLAWRAARRAYVEAKLGLTAQQRPLWDKLQSIAQTEQQKERQLCQELKPREELTLLDRLDRTQQFLSAKLDALQSARPALQALYQSLTPEQQAIMNHPLRP